MIKQWKAHFQKIGVQCFIYNYCLTRMFANQTVKLEEIRAPALLEANSQAGPFKLTRADSDSAERREASCQWTLTENAKYAAFIEANVRKMEGKPHGKLWALYHEMEKFIKSRNFRQCKSHHQKMLNQHSTIPEIISSLVLSQAGLLTLLDKERELMAKGQQKVQEYFPGQKYEEKHLPATGTSYDNPAEETDFGMRSDKKLNSFASLVPSGFSSLSVGGLGKRGSQYEEEWRECHNLFLEWTGRLNNLMRPSFGF